MKTKVNRLALVLLGGLVAGGAPQVRAMTVEALRELLAQGEHVTLIDVRGVSEYQQGHISGAINIPASVCARKNLPPLGRVIVYGSGLGKEEVKEAASYLSNKEGIEAEVLEGGLAGWESGHGMTTRAGGLSAEELPRISYDQLKRAEKQSMVLVDLRQRDRSPLQSRGEEEEPLTDLGKEFPGVPVVQTPFGAEGKRLAGVNGGGGEEKLLVLIDEGDGKAVEMARILKGNGRKRVVILAGGEKILARQGRPGLQRQGQSVEVEAVPER